ncbi:hypothetical protein [Bhargavaea cecembensis]|uniref:hypothetical protein n=1 Tax=Bhargavaea cecembensis TaxID=394098 RepID=UPI000349A5AC|nr:hypothetical protein [Bhargavaea cecembensis]
MKAEGAAPRFFDGYFFDFVIPDDDLIIYHSVSSLADPTGANAEIAAVNVETGAVYDEITSMNDETGDTLLQQT